MGEKSIRVGRGAERPQDMSTDRLRALFEELHAEMFLGDQLHPRFESIRREMDAVGDELNRRRLAAREEGGAG